VAGVRVILRYYSVIRKAAGTAREVEDLEAGCTLGELIERICRRHGAAFSDLVSGGSRVEPRALILLDGVPVKGARLAEPAPDGAELSFFPPMAGG